MFDVAGVRSGVSENIWEEENDWETENQTFVDPKR